MRSNAVIVLRKYASDGARASEILLPPPIRPCHDARLQIATTQEAVMRLLRSSVALGSLLLLGAPSVAQTIDPDASVVHLRTTCTIDDCFDDTDDLTAWLWGGSGRNNPPSANDRVAIHVGPGDFDPFKCDGTSRRSRLRERDRLGPATEPVRQGRRRRRQRQPRACRGGIHIENCQKIDFSHVAGVGYDRSALGGRRFRDLVGRRHDRRADRRLLRGGALGWYDVPGEGGRSVQHIFGSRAIARNHPWTMSGSTR